METCDFEELKNDVKINRFFVLSENHVFPIKLAFVINTVLPDTQTQRETTSTVVLRDFVTKIALTYEKVEKLKQFLGRMNRCLKKYEDLANSRGLHMAEPFKRQTLKIFVLLSLHRPNLIP